MIEATVNFGFLNPYALPLQVVVVLSGLPEWSIITVRPKTRVDRLAIVPSRLPAGYFPSHIGQSRAEAQSE